MLHISHPLALNTSKENLFDDLGNDIAYFSQNNAQVLLMGDFNARTSNLDDFVQKTDSHFTNTEFLTSEISTSRKNCDGELNSSGHALLDICKSTI